MKIQECILLIFATISFWAEPFSAVNCQQGYSNPLNLNWPTSADILESSPFGYDKSSFESNSDEESCCNLYNFVVKRPNGQDVCLKQYAGKVLIILNYASGCGFTQDNVCTLTEFSNKYRACGLEILVFPSNDFSQNFGGNTAAQIFADNHPQFEVFAEICVNGRAQHPMYRFLKNKLPGAFNTKTIKWNFTKFVVDRNGCPIQRFAATDGFTDLEELIQELLKNQNC
ncbi:glutathione peroxidase 1-like [Myzus persicae]|uniref:glutathione peroxidase 1-like n=1 Tax=Myzus persicae TaxID=13164 RepID=UPI000B931CFC|nr:glutathione peroxidase 1-like [Myzus persicae]